MNSSCPSRATTSIPCRTLPSTCACDLIPRHRNVLRLDSTTHSSRCDLADVTISLARHTLWMLERERFADSRCATRVSSWVLGADSTEARDEDCEDGETCD